MICRRVLWCFFPVSVGKHVVEMSKRSSPGSDEDSPGASADEPLYSKRRHVEFEPIRICSVSGTVSFLLMGSMKIAMTLKTFFSLKKKPYSSGNVSLFLF